MKKSSTSFYITTPIYYVNDKPHIGHAYTSIVCDMVARFKRLDGFDVLYLTGTDEHGQKIEKSARQLGISPQALADQVSAMFHDLAHKLQLSHDVFIRTTEARHIKSAQAFWQKLVDCGQIYLGSYQGWYAISDEAFYSEDELTQQPDGTYLAPTGAKVEWVSEQSYFFKLSAWQKPLLDYYQSLPDAILPTTRRNEVIRFIEGGLSDLSVSRTGLKWGIPVPNDPDHVIYVWIDALTNYITALGFPDIESDLFQTFWSNSVHVMGKDIVRFHAIYWPALLMAAGLKPPSKILAHGWIMKDGQKMSKSLGNILSPDRLIEIFGVDALRYFLLREIPLGHDGVYSDSAMIQRLNSDLANDIGNLAQRVLSMIYKNCHGAIPNPGPLTNEDRAFLMHTDMLVPHLRTHVEQYQPHRYLEELWAWIGDGNRYVDAQAPWTLRKTDPDRMNTVLYVLADALRRMGILLQPVIPLAADRLLSMLGIPETQRNLTNVHHGPMVQAGQPLDIPTPLFPRYVEGHSDHVC